MSLGVSLLIGILLVVGAVWALQLWLARLGRASEGNEAPQPQGIGEVEGRLLWFHAPSCAPCRAMHPDIEGLGDRVIEVDVSQRPDIARAYGVMATPTTIRVKNGRILASRSGRLGQAQLTELLSS